MMMSNTKDENSLIEHVYYSVNKGGAFAGVETIYRVLKSKGHNVARSKIKQRLQDQDNYSLQKPVRRKFRRPKVIGPEPYEQYDADLADVSNIAAENNKIRFLIICIDVFSKFLWIQPIRDRKALTVLNGFKQIFARTKIPLKFRTDAGSEFCKRWMKRYLKQHGIYHHVNKPHLFIFSHLLSESFLPFGTL